MRHHLVQAILLGSALYLTGSLSAADQQTTWHEHRFRYIEPQELDISCGATSIASLIKLYSGVPMDEAQILNLLASIVDKADHERVLAQGFSLLNVKQAVSKLGFELKAAKVNKDQLIKFRSPAMLQMKTVSGLHFVLWHGSINGYHWISDPSRGEMWLSDNQLDEEHSGIAAWLYLDKVPLPQASDYALIQAWRMR